MPAVSSTETVAAVAAIAATGPSSRNSTALPIAVDAVEMSPSPSVTVTTALIVAPRFNGSLASTLPTPLSTVLWCSDTYCTTLRTPVVGSIATANAALSAAVMVPEALEVVAANDDPALVEQLDRMTVRRRQARIDVGNRQRDHRGGALLVRTDHRPGRVHHRGRALRILRRGQIRARVRHPGKHRQRARHLVRRLDARRLVNRDRRRRRRNRRNRTVVRKMDLAANVDGRRRDVTITVRHRRNRIDLARQRVDLAGVDVATPFSTVL